MSFLDIDGVHKRFGDNEVLRGVDLSVDEHQVVCLIGASGSGKSTLLRCINGLEPIDSGEIRIEDERVTGRGVDVDWLRQEVGIVFQSFNLFPHMSVLHNVTLAPVKVLKLPKAYARERAMALLSRIGSRRRPASTRIACRAASSSASPSRGRWPWVRACSCSTR